MNDDIFDSRDFYEVCQQYRWAKETSQVNVIKAFDALKDFCRAALERSEHPVGSADRTAIARAIWNIRREADDRCDMELEDMGKHHPVWDEADAVLALATPSVGTDAFAKGWEEGVAFERSDKEGPPVIDDLRAASRDAISKLEEARSYLEHGWAHAAKAQIDFALSVLAGNADHAKQDAPAVKETWWFKKLREFWETDPGAITAAVNMALNHIAATPSRAPVSVQDEEPLSMSMFASTADYQAAVHSRTLAATSEPTSDERDL